MADNRDPGKDRERDKDINTGIDAEEADDIFTKDPWTTEDAVLDDDPSSHRPTRLGRKWITEAVRGVAGGMAGALNEELERRAPNLSVVKTELTDTWDDIKELREDLTKQLQPFTRSMENIARRILPRAKRAMPESWYKKMETTLQQRADERAAAAGGSYSKEEEQASTIRSELEAVFAQQQEHTLEVEHKKELDQKKERMIEQGLAATRHKADMRIYTRIYDAVRGTELFHRTLHTAYMKKSLEVQYKHFFVAQDTYNLLAQSFSAFEEYMRGVVKNTGLPDAAKANASDYLKELRTQKYGMLMSEYLTNARKMIFGKIKSAASDALSGVSMAASMAEMAPDMADAYMQEHGGAGGVGARVAGWILGRTKGSGLIRAGLDKIAPWVTALNGRTANFKDRLYLGIDKLQRQWSNDNNPFKQFIAQFLPNVSGITGAPNDLLRDPEKPAVYDKATRQTIVEIIPGYLRHILHEVAMFRTGRDDLPMMTYNRYRRIFTSSDQFRKDMMNDQAMADSPETQAYRVNSFIQVIAKGAVSKNPGGPKDGGANAHAKTISKIMANHAVYNKPFDPDRLFEYVNNHKIDSYIEAIMSDIDPREFDATARIILNGITNKDGTLNPMLANSIGDTITQMRMADQYKVTLPRNFEAFGDRDLISETAGEVYVDKKGIKRVFRNAQRGIVRDATGEISKSFLSDRLSDLDESKITSAEEIASTYGYEELEKHLSADEFVKNQVTAWKVSFEDSAPGKAMTWLAAKLGWFFDPENDSKLPSLARVLAGSAAVSMGKEKLSDTEKRIRKLAKSSKVRSQEEASSSAAVVNIVEAASKGTKPKVKGTRAAPKRRRSAKQQEPEAVEAVSKEEIVKETPASEASGPTVVGGVALNVELPKTESKSSKIKQWFDDNLKRLDDSLDKIPQTPEDVEKQVASVVEFMDTAWKNRPKSAKDIQDKFENYIKHVSETHPELAKYALDRANELAQTRGYKFASAWTKYLNDKIGKKATKWIKDGYDAAAKKASDAKTKLQSKASEIANNVIKASGSKMDAGIAFTAINPFAKKEDREAARELIASEDPDLLKNLESHFKKEASDLYGTAKEKFSSAMDATGGFIKDTTKTAGNWWSQLRAKWRDGTGAEESPERPSATGVSTSLMSLLEEWRASQTRAHATLIEAAEHLINVVEHRSFSPNETPGGDGRYVSIKEFNRDSYGFFGVGGKIVGGLFKRTASAVGKGAWWLGKTMAKGYVHAAMLPFQIPYYAVKGVAKVGGWAANSIGINPFRDIYVVGEDKPILTWRKQASKEGVFFEGTNTRPKSSKEIIEKGLPIVDHEGQYLITEEDIKKGLWAKDSSVAKGLGAVAGGIIKAPFSVASAYIKMETEVIKGVFGIGKTIAKGIFGAGAPEKYVDVYRKGDFKKPILTRRKQKEGVYLKDKDGNFSRLERSSDIHEPVYEIINGEPQEVVSEDDIEHGLCDVNGKPLGSGQYRGGLLGAALGLGAGIGKLGLKVLGGGLGMYFSFWKNTFGILGKAGGAVVSGVRQLGARLFGFDTKSGHGAVAFRGVTDRLDTIIELMRSGSTLSAGTRGGEGGILSGKPKKKKSTPTSSEDAPASKSSEKKPVTGSKPASSKVGGSGDGKGKSVKDKISWGFNKDDDDDDDSSWMGWLLGGGSGGVGGVLLSKGRQKVKDILTGANRPRTIVKHPDGKFRTLDGKLVSAEEVKAARGRIWEKGKDGIMRDHNGKPVKDTTLAKRKASDKGKSSPVDKTAPKKGKGGKTPTGKGTQSGKPTGRADKFKSAGKKFGGWVGGILGAKLLWDSLTNKENGDTLAERVENADLAKVAPNASLASAIPEYLLANKAPGLSRAFGKFNSWFMPILASTATAQAVDNSDITAASLTGKSEENLTQTEKDVAKANAMGTAAKDYNPYSFAADLVNMGWQVFGGNPLWDGSAHDAVVRKLTGSKSDAEVFRKQVEYAEWAKKNGLHDPAGMSKLNSSMFKLGWDGNSSIGANLASNTYNLLGKAVTHWDDQGYSAWNPAEWIRVGHNAATDTATYAANSVVTLLELPWAWEKAKNEAAGITIKADWAAERQMRKLIKVTQMVSKIFEEEGVKLPPDCYHTYTAATKNRGLKGEEKILHSKGDVNLESETFQQLWQKFSSEKNKNGKSFFSRNGEDVTREFAKWLVKQGFVDKSVGQKSSKSYYYKTVKTLRWMKPDNTPYHTYNISGDLAKSISENEDVKKIKHGNMWPEISHDGSDVDQCVGDYLAAFDDVRLFYLAHSYDTGKKTTTSKTVYMPTYGGMLGAPMMAPSYTETDFKTEIFSGWFNAWINYMATDTYGAGAGYVQRADGGFKGWWNHNMANSSVPIVRWLSPTMNIDRRPSEADQKKLRHAAFTKLDELWNKINEYILGKSKQTDPGAFVADLAYKVIDEMESDGTIENGITGDAILENIKGHIEHSREYRGLTEDEKKKFDETIKENVRHVLKETHPELAKFTGDEKIESRRRVDRFANTVVSSLRNPATRKKIFDKYNVAYNPDDPDYTTLANAISREVPQKYMGLTDAADIEEARDGLRSAILDKIYSGEISRSSKTRNGVAPGVDKSWVVKTLPSKDAVTPAKVEATKLEAVTAQHEATAKAISTAVGPTIEAAKQLDNSKAITDGLNSMTNLQNKSFSLLGSVIGPNGLKVEGIPELTAITAAKPSGGNVTHVTNVMPVQTQDEGLDVRASQK